MKLAEIKIGLVEHFFKDSSNGVLTSQLNPIFESIGNSLSSKTKDDMLTELYQSANQSSNPTKAFKRFTEGRIALLTIIDEDNTIFTAARAGKKIIISDLTVNPITERAGDLTAVKSAIYQAKKINDEIFYNIAITDIL